MDDATLLARLWAGLAHQQALFGAYVPEATAASGDGWVASVVPTAAASSMLNAVVAMDAGGTIASLGEISALFAPHGVKWGIWLDSRQSAEAAALESARFTPMMACSTMAAMLEDVDLGEDRAAAPLPADLKVVGALNDRAYGLTDRRLEKHFGALPTSFARGYRADAKGRPEAVLALTELDGDAHVIFVATLPHARRRGVARELMRGALREARARGLATTSLLATEMGRSLYRGLGYRHLGEAVLWEWRGT